MITTELLNPSDWNKYKDEIMAIENQFDESLQFEEEDVKEMCCGEYSITVLLKEDGKVIGDCYAQRIEDCGGDYFTEDGVVYWKAETYKHFGEYNTVYVASTAVLKSHQGRGLIKPLRDFFEDSLRNIGIKYVTGHTQGKMLEIVKRRGADVIQTFEDWYDCGEIHYLYEMNLWKQDKEYNCGVYAVSYLLHTQKSMVGLTELEKMLNPTEADGVSHETIIKVLHKLDKYTMEFSNATLINLNNELSALVNYQYDGDGHYGVVCFSNNGILIIYNPYIGNFENVSAKEFEKNWYSERYGKKWMLSI